MDAFPSALLTRIKRFLEDGCTGQITLNASDGHIRTWVIAEHGKDSASDEGRKPETKR